MRILIPVVEHDHDRRLRQAQNVLFEMHTVGKFDVSNAEHRLTGIIDNTLFVDNPSGCVVCIRTGHASTLTCESTMPAGAGKPSAQDYGGASLASHAVSRRD